MAKLVATPLLNSTKNEARSPSKPTMSGLLKKAIRTLSAELLRDELEFICREYPAIIPTLESRLLVQGKDVVPYHADTESGDHADSDNEREDSASESENGDDSEEYRPVNTTKKGLIATGHAEWTPRIAKCENCKEEFDVTSNKRGDCRWHSNLKDVDYDADIWADHDPDCHGPYDIFEDDASYAEGFLWMCCDKSGNDEGCMSTKHKAAVNTVVKCMVRSNMKRKAEDEALGTSAKKERRCSWTTC